MVKTLSLNEVYATPFGLLFDHLSAKEDESMQIDIIRPLSTIEDTCYIMVNNEFKKVLRSQLWFWDTEVQKKIEKAEQEIENGEYEEYDTAESFVDSLFK